jgi:streptogramin lyase
MNHHTPPPLKPQPFCVYFEPLLPLLSQGQLPDGEAAATRTHVMTCAWCQLQLRDYDFLRDALRRLDSTEAPDGRAPPSYRPLTREELHAAFQEDSTSPRHPTRSAAVPVPARALDAIGRDGRFPSLTAVAATLLIVVLAAVLFRGAALRPASPRISGTFTFVALPSAASHPTSIVFGPDGHLWFTESGADKIGRMTVGGTVTEFPLSVPQGSMPSSSPTSIITGPDGNLWFAEPVADKIGRITPQGVITEFAPPSESHPRGIALGPDGTLWYAALATNRIGHLSPDGQFLGDYAPPTAGSGLDSIVSGPDGNLWFIEAVAGKIGRITPQGIITEFDSPLPVDRPIVAGPDGNLWFISALGGKIGRITPQGRITFFPANRLDGTLAGLSAGPDGTLWFVLNAAAQSSDPPRIGRITPDGEIDFVQCPVRGVLNGLTFGPDGTLWFTVNDPAQIGHFQLKR